MNAALVGCHSGLGYFNTKRKAITRSNTYLELGHKLSYWRSTSKFEVDLIIGKKWAIEFKSSNHTQEKHLKGLRALKEEGLLENYLIVSRDRIERITSDKIHCLPWNKFLDNLWAKKL